MPKSQNQSQSEDSVLAQLNEPQLPPTRSENAPVLAIPPKYEMWGYVMPTPEATGVFLLSDEKRHRIYAGEVGRIACIDRPERGKYRYLVTVAMRGAQGWFNEEELEPAPEDYKPQF